MRKLIIKIIAPFLQLYAKRYFSKTRKYRYKEVKGVVLPGVFYPHWTLSTKLFMEFIEPLDLQKKTVLELGCGTGFISVLAAKKGAKVFASDINPKAIQNVCFNADQNGVELETMVSDLFEKIPPKHFDFIFINPPYYPKQPKNREEEAWFCGENFEYFQKLFAQIPNYFDSQSKVYMILSEDCEINHIVDIAIRHKVVLEKQMEKRKWGEKNYIFQLKSI